MVSHSASSSRDSLNGCIDDQVRQVASVDDADELATIDNRNSFDRVGRHDAGDLADFRFWFARQLTQAAAY